MSNNTQFTVKNFQKGWSNTPKGLLSVVQDEINDSNGWSISTFYARKKGTRKFRDLEAESIKAIFKKYHIRFK